MDEPRLAGAVLTGGRSSRMGRDKALLPVDGVPLAVRVARALVGARAAPVVAVGGDLDALRRLGLEAIDDPNQGRGPLGGIVTALRHLHTSDAVAVLACDLPDVAPDGIRRVATALGDADVAVPVVDGRRETLHAVWRPGAAEVIEPLLAGTDRSVRAALDLLRVVEVEGLDPAWFRNLNHPQDLSHD